MINLKIYRNLKSIILLVFIFFKLFQFKKSDFEIINHAKLYCNDSETNITSLKLNVLK